MEQKPIYLCYNVSYCGRCLEYIGDNFEDCVAQMKKEHDLSKEERDQLRATYYLMVEMYMCSTLTHA